MSEGTLSCSRRSADVVSRPSPRLPPPLPPRLSPLASRLSSLATLSPRSWDASDEDIETWEQVVEFRRTGFANNIASVAGAHFITQRENIKVPCHMRGMVTPAADLPLACNQKTSLAHELVRVCLPSRPLCTPGER